MDVFDDVDAGVTTCGFDKTVTKGGRLIMALIKI